MPELRVLSQLEEVCAPVVPFERMVNKDGQAAYEPVPQATRSLKDRIVENMPQEIPFTGDKGIKLQDVADGLASMEDFVAQLTPEDLEALSRGDYIMGSSLGALGNAGVLGGITESLRALGVPPATTTDGPSRHPAAVLLLLAALRHGPGMRLEPPAGGEPLPGPRP